MSKFEQRRIELLSRFQKFIKNVSPEEKLVLCFHRDADGIASGLNVSRALEKFCGKKPDYLFAVDYTDLDEVAKKLAFAKPEKIIAVDLGLDSFKERFTAFSNNCNEMLFIDHHKLYNDFSSEKVVFIKAQQVDEKLDSSHYCVAKLTYDLFSRMIDISENDWLTCIGIIGDKGDEVWEKFLVGIMRKYNVSMERLNEATEIVNAVETIAPEKFLELFDFLYNVTNITDFIFSPFAQYRKQLHAEVNPLIDSFEEKAEHFPTLELSILEVKPKHNIKSFLVNSLSQKFPEQTIIVMQDLGDGKIWFSARRQDFRVKMNELLETAVKGIPSATAGGHIPAAAGSIPKEFAKKFKENLKKVLNERKAKN